jgi:hypothetical protein
MKCPDCNAELVCPCPSPEHKDKPGIKWEHRNCDIIGCPICGFNAHMDYWEARTYENKSPYQNVPFTPKTHSLKIKPKYFYQLFTGNKTFEIRKNDRGFKIGHCIIFNLWSPDRGYCSRSLAMEIVNITDFPEGLRPGYVVLGVRKI